MNNFYVASCGEYSSYGIMFIFKSPNIITRQQFREYYLESIKRSAEFQDKQTAKLVRYFNDDLIKSTNYYNRYDPSYGKKVEVSYEDWWEICQAVGVEENPNNWLENILVENGCEIITYEEFNVDG